MVKLIQVNKKETLGYIREGGQAYHERAKNTKKRGYFYHTKTENNIKNQKNNTLAQNTTLPKYE